MAVAHSPTERPELDEPRDKDKSLTTWVHEIRNPLSALRYALQVLSSVQHDPVQVEELRENMERQVDQMARLSDRLLASSRNAQGTPPFRQELVPIGRLIEAACEQIQPLIRRRKHSLRVQLRDEPMVVFGDPSRLLQVFANLVQNAAKFTDPNGSLRISVESQQGNAVVRISDNGPGIELHRQSTIYESHRPVRGSRAIANGGLGIGLPLVKTIVEFHGGSVGVHSEGLGYGSEFIVRLPLAKEAVPRPQPANERSNGECNGNSPPSLPYRIVVLDDDRSQRELLARVLRKFGHSVTVASDAATAIEIVIEQQPQIVFLDLMMRDMDGCDVARRLREEAELAAVVLIALSGNGDDASQRRALDAGFDRYLTKPVSVAELATTLADIPHLVRHAGPSESPACTVG